jgi:RHS repeat-associated protein
VKKLKTGNSLLLVLLAINFFFLLLFYNNVYAVTCSPSPTISGADTVTAPGTYQYTVNNPQGEIRWCVTGSGVNINASGVVTLSSSACGSFTVSATDADCGQVGSKNTVITNGGSWVVISDCSRPPKEPSQYCSPGSGYGPSVCEVGDLRYSSWWCTSWTSAVGCDGTAFTCSIGNITTTPCQAMCKTFGSSGQYVDNIYRIQVEQWQCSGTTATTCAGGCTLNSTKTCYTGQAGTADVGECKSGTQTCSNYQWGTCQDEVTPTTEICDGKDNDCDGQVDEGCCPEIESFKGSDTTIDPTAGGSIVFTGDIKNPSNAPLGWTLSVPGKTFTGSGTSVNVTWDGKDASGKVIEPGTYTATLTATSDGCTDSESISFTVKSTQDCKLLVDFASSANIASGNLYHSQTLFSIPNSKILGDFTLSYNSLDGYSGPLGIGWTHAYNINLKENNDGSFSVMEGDGRRTVLYQNGSYYTPETSSYPILTKNTDGTYTLTHKDNTIYNFNSNGKITSITDRNSNALTFSYDSNNNLTSVTDPSGRSITLSYNSTNTINTIKDPNGNTYTFTYTNDALTGISTMSYELIAKSWSYTYDSNAFMLTKTDPMGYTTTYTYDENHRVLTGTDSESKVKSITYPTDTNTVKTTTVTEKDGGIWTYKYDTSAGTLNEKADPEGNTTTYSYDSNKNMTSTTDPDGSVTSYTYDSERNMTSVTDAEGNVTSYTYNTIGQVTSITDSEGNVTQYTYDTKGNLTSTRDATGATTQYQYDSKGNITSITNANGQTTTFTYDQYNNLTSVTDSTGATTTFTYDSAGNMISQTDSQGNTTRFEYNSLNQLIKITDPQGNATTYTYDSNGNRTSQTDANGNSTYYEYNYKGQLIKVTDSLGNVTQYTYGSGGCSSCGSSGGDNLTSITDAKGQTTTYQYDSVGRLIKETDPLGNTITYSYDSKGNLKTKTNADGNTITYAYDSLSRLTKKTYPDGNVEKYEYDSKGNITYVGNQYIAYNFTYDANGRVLAVVDSNGLTISYQYDSMGNRTQMTTPEGKVINYSYDSGNRLSQINSDAGNFNLTYDSLGRRTKLTYSTGAYTTYSYDSNSRLTNLIHKTSQGSAINSFAYTHDNVGNRLTKTETNTKYAYSYDGIYRLLQSVPTKLQGKDKEQENKAEYFSYDAVGNRLTGPKTKDYYSYNVGNQLINDRKHQYQYDANGNLIKKTETDDDGETKTWTYSYDYENRLIKVVKQEEDETKTITFNYDSFGRRIEKKVEEVEDGKVEETKTYNYVYDNEDIILEYLTEIEDDEIETETTRYIHGLGIDEPLSIESEGDVYYYHADGLGSITALTNNEQEVVQSYTYDSFGNLKDQKEQINQPYTFTGREWDEETGLYYYRARYYDAAAGRFISFDPILRGISHTEATIYRQSIKAFPLAQPPKLHPFVYVENRPINLGDPLGLNSKGNYYFYAAGTWNADTTFEANLGQGVIIKVKNINVLGTTISIESNWKNQSHQAILLPQQQREFKFTVLGCEPIYWKFRVSTQSDAFIVTYEIKSTWVTGMPPNR